MESTSKCCTPWRSKTSCYTILTLWSQLQNSTPSLNRTGCYIPYWLCGVNFKIVEPKEILRVSVYHTDSVESTSKSPSAQTPTAKKYTILTLWSQLQNHFRSSSSWAPPIPYWLCGVNFKIDLRSQMLLAVLYHTDSVESTSKWGCLQARDEPEYTILTLWSQLQNNFTEKKAAMVNIPYWLCGVNFKIRCQGGRREEGVYHTDSVESTSKYRKLVLERHGVYTILTLWSQLQNAKVARYNACHPIPYWLCGVNFKMDACGEVVNNVIYHTDSVESTSKWAVASQLSQYGYTILTLWSQLQNWYGYTEAFLDVYHTDSVESTSKSSEQTAGVFMPIPYWLCGVNFKIYNRVVSWGRSLYHTDSVESTSK